MILCETSQNNDPENLGNGVMVYRGKQFNSYATF